MKPISKSFNLFALILLALLFGLRDVQPARAGGPSNWYVAATGSDANTCAVAALPCLTINGAIAKASAGDTVMVAIGTYTGTDQQVVTIDKAITLSGGWDAGFITQNGVSTIDGQAARAGMLVNSGVAAIVGRLEVRNGGGPGIDNQGDLTLNDSAINGNTTSGSGGGIYSTGTLTLNGSTVSGNTAGGWGGGLYSGGALTINDSVIRDNLSYGNGGGIYNGITLTINNSAVSGNSAAGYGGGGLYNFGSLTLNNTTISGNTASDGAGLASSGIATFNNATISANIASNRGGGIYQVYGAATLKNSLLAGNTAATGPDCWGALGSAGYNLLGDDTGGCAFTAAAGDLTNVSPNLGSLIGSPAYYPLLAGSPAIDAGNPATPGSGGDACAATDQRGVARVGPCDIGAYEYTLPGSPASIAVFDGSPQRAAPLAAFDRPLEAAVLDSLGSPVSGATVTFTAPASGASGVFADSGANVATAVTNASGIAATATFTANAILGAYSVLANVDGAGAPATFALTNITWYVATTGNDANDCAAPGAACASIDGAIAKALAGDTVQVATGTYTGSGGQVVLIDKSISLSGGWNATFTAQDGMSVINGQSARRGVTIDNGFAASLDRFIIQKSNQGGIFVGGAASALIVDNSVVRDGLGFGIYNSYGTLVISNSAITGNTNSNDCGGGIYNRGALTINNSTISGNVANAPGWGAGGGICNYSDTLTLHNTTVAHNSARSGGGIAALQDVVILENSIVAENINIGGSHSDCTGNVTSAGHNLIGNTADCSFTPQAGDITDVNAGLGQLIGSPAGYVPLLPGSPAIDAANLATCPARDQRGVARPVGASCDMGAYEYQLPGAAVSFQLYAGSGQTSPISFPYSVPLSAYIMDSVGSPVAGVKVMFTAPASGPGGIFADTKTYTTSAVTDNSGLATASTFTANSQWGSYTVGALATGFSDPVTFALRNLPVPITIAPTGAIKDTTPAYQWSKIAGATQYQYQLWQGARLVYAKIVSAGVCGATTCSSTPTMSLGYSGYQWKVQAMVGGVWQTYSAFKAFNILLTPTAGFWGGSGLEFYVTANQARVDNFAIYIRVTGCGHYKITHGPLTPIVDRKFLFTGSFYASGVIDTATRAHGTLGLTSFLIPGCGRVSGGPFAWIAAWKNALQPAVSLPGDVAPVLVEPTLEAVPGAYSVERVDP